MTVKSVRFLLSNGDAEEIELTPFGACQGRVQALIPQPPGVNPFVYAPGEGRNEAALKRIGELNALIQRQFRPGLPNVLLPDDRLVLTDEVKLDLLRSLLPQLAGRVNAVFFPNRGRNCRKLCDYLYEFLRCQPSVLVFGMGLEDFAEPGPYGLPDIDIDEFRFRMDWLFDMVRRQLDIRLLVVLNPPHSNREPPAAATLDGAALDGGHRNQALCPRAAEPYFEALVDLCREHGVRSFDAAKHYPADPRRTTVKEPWAVELTRNLAAAICEASIA